MSYNYEKTGQVSIMTQQKTEEQLKVETIKNIQRIIQFLHHSEDHKHQEPLTKALQSMVNGKNKPVSKGATAEERTLASLKLAIAHLSPNGWKTSNSNLTPAQEKGMLINDCMGSIKSHVANIPEYVINGVISDYMTDQERTNLEKASPRLFKSVWTSERLLSAVFMGEESIAERIVRSNPELLFKRHTYKMPLLNEDGTLSDTSEQIYHDVTPLRLMLYTGDWKMWDHIFPLIPEKFLEETLREMRNISRGGPDLVKINRDPGLLSTDELKYFHERDEQGKQKLDSQNNPIAYELLSNPDGIFYVESGNQVQLYHVKVNPDTQEKQVVPLQETKNMTPEDKTALNQLKDDIRNNMPMNSGRRTSDKEHALIERVFGIKLERNGIHCELNGIPYHNTYDGCINLINDYRNYLDIYDAPRQPGTSRDNVDAAWERLNQAQRRAMVSVIQRICEVDKPFYPLPNNNDLKTRELARTTEFEDWVDVKMKAAYPLQVNSGGGGSVRCLLKADRRGAVAEVRLRWAAVVDLAAVRQIVEARKARFNELMHEIDQKLNPSSINPLVLVALCRNLGKRNTSGLCIPTGLHKPG